MGRVFVWEGPAEMARRNVTGKRKSDHLALCLSEDVEFQRKRSWLEHAELIHEAVPELDWSDLDLAVRFLGRTLSLPFCIGAMTGGTAAAAGLNRGLAEVAQEKGIGLALGSQRAMLEDAAAVKSYAVRRYAPDILLLGNIGMSQAMGLKTAAVRALVEDIGADGINLHLNTAMELFQKEGDLPAGRAYRVIGRLARALGEKLIVKETGCGISRETARRLMEVGVRTVDVAGAGGTSWVRVENLRRGGKIGEAGAFEEWGIPTAASLLEVKGLGLRVIASGGLRSGLDVARAVALGAEMGSAALPVLRALKTSGRKGLCEWIDALGRDLRTAMMLAGCGTVRALQRAPLVLSGPLREWAAQRQAGRSRQ